MMTKRTETPAERLKRARIAAGYRTAKEFSDKNGFAQPTYHMHEKGKANGGRDMKVEVAELYAAALGNCDAAWLLAGVGKEPGGHLHFNPPSVEASNVEPHGQQFVKKPSGTFPMQADDAAEPNTSPAPNAPGLTPAYLLPRDLPVLGTAECGPNGVFEMNGGEPINYERRPVILSGNRKAFAVYAHGDSMEPLFFSGDTVYIDPGRPPTVGRAVLVEFHPVGDENPRGMIKVLMKVNSEFVELRQLNPDNSAKPFRFKRREIKAIFRVLTNQELAGG